MNHTTTIDKNTIVLKSEIEGCEYHGIEHGCANMEVHLKSGRTIPITSPKLPYIPAHAKPQLNKQALDELNDTRQEKKARAWFKKMVENLLPSDFVEFDGTLHIRKSDIAACYLQPPECSTHTPRTGTILLTLKNGEKYPVSKEFHPAAIPNSQELLSEEIQEKENKSLQQQGIAWLAEVLEKIS